jgi:hypothetical protein
MSTIAATILTIGCFGIAGIVPAWAMVGPSGSTLAFAILIGAVETAVAGACSLVIAWSTLPWFFIVAAAVTLVSAFFLIQRWRGRSADNGGTSALRTLRARLPGAAVVATLGLTLVWCLVPLRVPSVGWDARAIWLLRATWFARGHDFLLVAFRSPGELIAHASYPPLISTAVASSWQLTGNHTERLGVVIVALLNASATLATSWVIVEVGRHAARRQDRDKRVSLAEGVGIVCAALFTLVTFGIFGPFATNGYADPLWSVAAVGAIGYGLILPPNRRNLAASAILLAVSGLTKTEGVGTAIVLVILIALRYSLSLSSSPDWHQEGSKELAPDRRRGLGSIARTKWKAIVASAAVLIGVSLWPILARLENATRDVNTSGSRQGTWISRAHLTLDAIAPHLHVLFIAVPVALVGGVLLGRHRTGAGLGSDLWAWLGLLGGLSVVISAYVTGPGNTAFWLLTSAHRTTMFAATAAWLIVAVWAVVAAASIEDERAPSPQTTSAPPDRALLTTMATSDGEQATNPPGKATAMASFGEVMRIRLTR